MKNKKGFTLVEMVIAVAILAIIMVTLGGIFTNSFGAYRVTKQFQHNVEDAQFAMNLIGKTIRTSKITFPSASAATSAAIQIYDYSQSRCIVYRFDTTVGSPTENSLLTYDPGVDEAACEVTDYRNNAGAIILLDGNVKGAFWQVFPADSNSNPPVVGKATISAEVCGIDCSSTDIKHRAHLQTTTSMRNK